MAWYGKPAFRRISAQSVHGAFLSLTPGRLPLVNSTPAVLPLGPLRRILGDGLVVPDANGQSLAYVMSRVNDSDFQCLFTLRNHSTN